jgi:hypothetical protein
MANDCSQNRFWSFLLGIGAGAAVVLVVDHFTAGRSSAGQPPQPSEEEVDRDIEMSFPASDAYTSY